MAEQPGSRSGPVSVAWSLSSDDHPDAFDGYRQSIADLYDVSEVAAAGATGFSSRTTAYGFGTGSVARARSVPQTLTRGSGQIGRSGIDHISVILNQTRTVGDCDGRDVNAEAGSVQFRDLARPSSSRTDGIDVINLLVPRTSLPSWLAGRGLHGLVLPATSAGGRLVSSHLRTLSEVAGELSEDEGVAAFEATFVIAERFLGQASTVTPLQTEAIHRTIRQRALRLIDALLSRGSIETAWIACALGVSRSSLYRAFETTGGVQACILNRRLDRAYVTIRMHHAPRLPLAEIATQHGFTSETAFVRAFRDRFGLRPDEVPRWTTTGQGQIPLPTTPGVYDRAAHEVIMDWLRPRSMS
ncbi:helix-turn-helix domain-containing protein [Brevundimonas sp.]|uniref:helix-turn-helix domain-containing protein n=1 Tax=Brevundimonas sp. TaxID=1871086 RepID=UPI003A8DD4EF